MIAPFIAYLLLSSDAPTLTSDCCCGRNFRPKLHRLVLDFTTASAKRYRSDYGRHQKYTLETLHCLLSLSLGSRQ